MVAQKLALNRQVTPPSTPIPPAPKPKFRSARDSFFATQRDEAAQSNIQAVLQSLLTPPPPNKQTDKQTNKQTDRQTNKQTNKTKQTKQNKTNQSKAMKNKTKQNKSK
jgi:hypothetical protein